MLISGGTRFCTRSISYHSGNVTVPWISWKFLRRSTTAPSRHGSGTEVSIHCATNRVSRRFLPNWLFHILRPPSPSRERQAFFLLGVEAAECLQGCCCLRGCWLVGNSGCDPGFSIPGDSKLDRARGNCARCDWISDCARYRVGLRSHAGGNQANGNCRRGG